MLRAVSEKDRCTHTTRSFPEASNHGRTGGRVAPAGEPTGLIRRGRGLTRVDSANGKRPYSLMLVSFLTVLTIVSAPSETKPKIGPQALEMHTDHGKIVLGLYPSVAPKHVARLLALAKAGVYDGNHFHRIQKRFVAQIASVEHRQPKLTKAQAKLVRPIPDEFSPLPHKRFTLSMAKWEAPNSAKTSFSILLGRARHLDGKFTVFGESSVVTMSSPSLKRSPLRGPLPSNVCGFEKSSWFPRRKAGRSMAYASLRSPSGSIRSAPFSSTATTSARATKRGSVSSPRKISC